MVKRCNPCGQTKPLSEFNKRSLSQDGYGPWCRDCRKQYQTAYYLRNRKRFLADKAEYRQRPENKEHNRLYQAEYRQRPENKESAREYQRNYRPKWQTANRDKMRAYSAKWSSDPKNKAIKAAYEAREDVRQRRAEYSARPENKNRQRRRVQEYAQRHPERIRENGRINSAIRRARLAGNGVIPFTIDQIKTKLTYWNNCCWICGSPSTAIDHVKPVTAGGAHVLCNLRPICTPCNSAKHNKWPLPSRAEILGFIE
jgi:5-methylcytosine-specific restriction endonuclease McrA